MKMKVSLFVAMFIMAASTSGFSQFVRFYKNFSDPNYKMSLSCVVPHNYNSVAGNVYVVGNIDSTAYPANNRYLYVAEMDPNGNILWDKRYLIKPINLNYDLYQLNSAIETSDGNLVVCGNLISSGIYHGFVLKIAVNSSGKNLVWFKRYKQNTSFQKVIESTTKQKYYACGQDQFVGNYSTGEDGQLTEVDPATGNFTVVSNRTMSGSDTWFGMAYDATQNAFFLFGRYNYNTSNTMMRESLTKLDGTTYAEQWTYPYVKNLTTDVARLYGKDLIEYGNNLAAVGAGDDLTTSSSPVSQQFIKTDLNGTLLAGMQYALPNGQAVFHQILPVPGTTDYLILGEILDTYYYYGRATNAVLLRVDGNGNIIWSNYYNFTASNYFMYYNTSNSGIRSSGMTLQGGYLYVTGMYDPNQNDPAACLMKVDPANGVIGSCSTPLAWNTSPITYQGPLTPMMATSGTFTTKKVNVKKIDPLLDWNVVCEAAPCPPDTVNLGDIVVCAGNGYTICNQTYYGPYNYYEVTCADSNGCVTTYQFFVISTLLTANAGPDMTVAGCCPAQLNASASGGNPGYTFTWSPTTGLSNPNIANPTCTIPGTYTVTVTDASGCTSSDQVVVTQAQYSCCRIGGNDAHALFDLYPNPTTGALSVIINASIPDNDQLIIADLSGKVMSTTAVDAAAAGNELKLSVDQLPTGMYLLYLLSDPAHVQKFVKQ